MNQSERPGQALDYFQQFDVRVDQATMEQIGVRTPEGKFIPFRNGEEFVGIQQPDGHRKPMIRVGGTEIDFEKWAAEQKE